MARRDRLDHVGFMERRGPAGAVADNVAMGCETEACARRMWMQSPRHRANMMLGGCQAVGSALSASGRSAETVVLMSAKPGFIVLVLLSPQPPAEAAVAMVLLVGISPSMEVTHRKHGACSRQLECESG